MLPLTIYTPAMQRVHTLSADVTSEAVRDGLEWGLGGFPPVEVLVNSAGVPPLDWTLLFFF